MTLLMSMASCNGDFTDWANPQTNPQEEKVVFGDGSVTAVDLIDFANIADDQTEVQVCQITAPTASDTAYKSQYTIKLGANETYTISADGKMATADLKSYVEKYFGKASTEHSISATLTFCQTNGIYTFKKTSDEFEVKAKLAVPEFSAYFYEIGSESNWKDSHALYGASYDGKYQGFYYLNGDFKFKPNADNWDNDYECAGEGKIADIKDGKNCPDPGAGFYQIDVNLAAGTYALTEVKSITCVGNHNGWKEGDANCHMTYNTVAGCWELTTALKDGFKFAMNDTWDTSWGGADGNPTNYDNLTVSSGKDLNVPDGEGTYKIQLYLSCEGANKVVLTKQ